MSWNDAVIEQFRAGTERIADRFDRNFLVILHTTGKRTGQTRLAPVGSFAFGDDLYVVASKAGAPTHPDWYHNLVADPKVTVERWEGDGLAVFDAVAETVEGDQRQEVWDRIVAAAPGFGEYQKQTDRLIPVVRLVRS
jgi:deazaflavin-dependent oxidoreductase (nitroreductase family)